jgi:hypothetical protein
MMELAMDLDVVNAVLGALVQAAGGVAGARWRRRAGETAERKALREIVTAAVEPALGSLPITGSADAREEVRVAVTEQLGHRIDVDPAAMTSPAMVIRAWLDPLTFPLDSDGPFRLVGSGISSRVGHRCRTAD